MTAEAIDPVAELEVKLTAAHETYSAAFAEREKAQSDLKNCGKRLHELFRESHDARIAQRSALHSQLNMLAIKPNAELSPLIVQGMQRARILQLAEGSYRAHQYAEARRLVLIAAVAEAEASLRLESLRRELHELRIQFLLGQVQSIEGGHLEVGTRDGAMAQHNNIVGQKNGELIAAREALEHHDAATITARNEFEKEALAWVSQ